MQYLFKLIIGTGGRDNWVIEGNRRPGARLHKDCDLWPQAFSPE